MFEFSGVSRRKVFGVSSSNLSVTTLLLTFLVSTGVLFAQPPETIRKAKGATVTPEQLSASFAEVAKIVEPAVVNIDTKGKVPENKSLGSGSDESSDPWLDLLRRRRMGPSISVGSGFVVDKSGYILTNYHVVEDSSRITVRLQSGEEYLAKIVGADDQTDLAVLKIEAKKELPFLRLGNSESARIGDWVLAIGSPFGLAQTVTAGIISQTKRETPYATAFQKFIQTDAAINRGNSGGPLVNMKGEVIGVNSQIATSTGDYNGIGFALPSNQVSYVYQQILRNGKVKRGYLGVLLDSVKKEFAQVYGMDEAKGAIITEIRDKQGAAARAGLKANDIIVGLNNQPIESHQDLIAKISSKAPGGNVMVTFLREKADKLERKNVTVKLAERPTNEITSDDGTRKKLPVNGQEVRVLPFGLTLIEISASRRRSREYKGLKGIVVTRVDPVSFISDVKDINGNEALMRGDLIQRINRTPITSVEEFRRISSRMKKGDPVVLHTKRYSRRSQTVIPRIVQFTVN
ncbi:MAG: PDZ domain-containing protein [Pyrinomonadaceae bacterium]|nr:PDZ domain-containing protein [Pyrinomonadaceae bacterium]